VEYAGVINGAAEVEAANAFIAYLISQEVNQNMPESNLMKSVLIDAEWPETEGYRFHTDEPRLNAEVSMERIGTEMETWLLNWAEATA
jgi:thiamine transport system substrate-binding protein